MLGSALVRHFAPRCAVLEAPTREHFDALRDGVAALDVGRFDWMVNAAGLINRRAGLGREAFLRGNSLFPRLLADACAAAGTRLIHVSTDCVLDGTRGDRLEDEPYDASDLYGTSKALGEPANTLVLRSSIFGPEERNRYNLLCSVLAQTGAVRGFVNHRWNGVTTLEFARAVERIMGDDLYSHGVRHVHGEGLTKHDLVASIDTTSRLPLDIVPHEDEQARHPGVSFPRKSLNRGTAKPPDIP